MIEELAPDRFTDEPVRAWKRARIVLDDGCLAFGGVGMTRATYGADHAAKCYAAPWHRKTYMVTTAWGSRIDDLIAVDGAEVPPHGQVPDLRCACGFYAVNDRRHLSRFGGSAELDVDLSGTVDVFARGYRAGHQRVLKVKLDKECPCGERAVTTCPVDDDRGRRPGFPLADPRGYRMVALSPTCGRHALGRASFTPERLALSLQTEVVWTDEPSFADDLSDAIHYGFARFLVHITWPSAVVWPTPLPPMPPPPTPTGVILQQAVAAHVLTRAEVHKLFAFLAADPLTELPTAMERVAEIRRRREGARLQLLASERPRRRKRPRDRAGGWWFKRPNGKGGWFQKPPDRP